MEEPWVDLLHAWCDHDSAHRGETVTIYATTKAPTFEAEAFRFGIYGGATGRLIWKAAAPIAGTDQPPPVVDPATNMRTCAHWTPSFTVQIGQDWTPGMYMFRLRAADGGATFVPLTVLDDRRADVLVVSAITTWNAYNTYGGASRYGGDGGGRRSSRSIRRTTCRVGALLRRRVRARALVESMASTSPTRPTSTSTPGRSRSRPAATRRHQPRPRRVLLGADPER
jgi:hypothetical protein